MNMKDIHTYLSVPISRSMTLKCMSIKGMKCTTMLDCLRDSSLDLSEIGTTNTRKSNHLALAYSRGKLVSVGKNSRRTSWLQRLYANKVGLPYKPYEHAEVAAIRRARKLDTLIVIRVNKQGKLMESKPCTICRALIQDSEIKNLYYSNSLGQIIHERL